MKTPARLLALAAALPFAALAAGPDTEAVEYYNRATNHYFITATAAEAKAIDAGAAGEGWVRTGRSFPAWIEAAGAPADAAAVCRFYSRGANSHFYTAGADECAYLKSLETAERQRALASGQPVLGWQYEGVAFLVEVPAGGACPAGTRPVSRVYNDGFATGEGANHRYVDEASLRELMLDRAWVGEGVAFCAREKSGGAGFGPPVTDFTALVAEWSGIGRWKAEQGATETRFLAPLILAIAADGRVTGEGDGCAFEGQVGEGDRFGSHFRGTIAATGCADAAFDGPYRKFHLERFSNGTLVVRLKRGDDGDEASIDAVLSAPGTVAPPPSMAAIVGRWSGALAWTASRRDGGGDRLVVTANRTLELAIDDLGALSGAGGGCSFAGQLFLTRPATFGGRIEASGCDEAGFDGTYVDVTVRRDDGRLRVAFEKEAESAGVRTREEIEGRLAPAGGTVPPPVPAPAAAGMAGHYAGPFLARVETRGTGPGNSPTSSRTSDVLDFTIGEDGAFSGTGFGCSFSGTLALAGGRRAEASGPVTATGCADATLSGTYEAKAEREGASLELELKRESTTGGVRTKVEIAGRGFPSP